MTQRDFEGPVTDVKTRLPLSHYGLADGQINTIGPRRRHADEQMLRNMRKLSPPSIDHLLENTRGIRRSVSCWLDIQRTMIAAFGAQFPDQLLSLIDGNVKWERTNFAEKYDGPFIYKAYQHDIGGEFGDPNPRVVATAAFDGGAEWDDSKGEYRFKPRYARFGVETNAGFVAVAYAGAEEDHRLVMASLPTTSRNVTGKGREIRDQGSSLVFPQTPTKKETAFDIACFRLFTATRRLPIVNEEVTVNLILHEARDEQGAWPSFALVPTRAGVIESFNWWQKNNNHHVVIGNTQFVLPMFMEAPSGNYTR